MEKLKTYIDLRAEAVNWLAKYLVQTGKSGFVVGLSGGIDSATMALMAQEAARKTGGKVLALLLPISSRGPDYYDTAYAMKIVKQFKLRHKVLSLGKCFNLLVSLLKLKTDKTVTYTNLKSRLRTAVLYFYANVLDYSVLGTVNKGELNIGYFPKNASAGDILPIAGLLKKEIRGIAKTYGLPEEIVNRKASGCIWADTAEEEWGFTEDQLDAMIEASEAKRPLRKIVGADIASRFRKLRADSVHKRVFYPIFHKGAGK